MRNSPSTQQLQEKALDLIPAGAHTYSRANFVFSENAPAFVEKAKGARFWDNEGKEFVDYGMGVLSVSLGHAYPRVVEGIKNQLDRGNSFSRPSLLEAEVAEMLVHLIPSAEMVKFAKNGSDVTSAAIRLARAYTGKKYIVRCAQQPFYSFDDWFIGSTSRPGGIPDEIRSQTLKFNYNDLISLEEQFQKFDGEVACVIMEPVTFEEPHDGFLEAVKTMCHRNGALLIFDEIITGFRWHKAGAQSFYKVVPDISTFGKGLANGFACSALAGKKEIMQLGNMEGSVFLLSCTYGGELVGLTAARETVLEFIQEPVVEHIWEYGKNLKGTIYHFIHKYQLQKHVKVVGYDARPDIHFFDQDGNYSLPLKTLFIQEMCKKGVLMERISLSFSHGESELHQTHVALDNALFVIRNELRNNTVMEAIGYRPIQQVFTY
jgi:glutamate-1-semialdehyde 2,1-aminomutase